MTDSYVSSRNGDASTGLPNGSSPSIAPNPQAHGISVIRKKLMGYVGFASLPNQVHRKSVRKGFSFTAMVVGQFIIHFKFSVASDVLPLLRATRRVRSRKVDIDQYPFQ